VLQTFTSDRGNKIVLGAYIATFVYALLVLRSVRDAENGVGGFVPSIAATVAILLALICVGLLIYFINHIAFSLQASTIISRVHRELLKQIDHLYPEPIGEPLPKESSKRSLLRGSKHEIKSKKGGFIALINEDGLTDIELKKARALHVLPKVGDFVVHGQVIAEVIDMPDMPPDIDSKVGQAIVIDARRSARQDPLYAVRQLVDMALKGLSPGINDMTTANYCIRFLGDALGRLANRQFPSSYRQFKDGECVLYLNKPTWDKFVEGAFYQVIHEAEGKVQVTKIILETIHRLAHELPNEERAQPLRKLVDHIEALILHTSYISVDKKYLEKRICSVRQALNEIR